MKFSLDRMPFSWQILTDSLANLAPQLSQNDISHIVGLIEGSFCAHSTFYKLSSIKSLPPELDNFIYDKTTDILIANCHTHPAALSFLYCFYKTCHQVKGNIDDFVIMEMNRKDFYTESEKYLRENFGFYLSSVGSRIMIGESYKMSYKERAIFSEFKLDRI